MYSPSLKQEFVRQAVKISDLTGSISCLHVRMLKIRSQIYFGGQTQQLADVWQRRGIAPHIYKLSTTCRWTIRVCQQLCSPKIQETAASKPTIPKTVKENMSSVKQPVSLPTETHGLMLFVILTIRSLATYLLTYSMEQSPSWEANQ